MAGDAPPHHEPDSHVEDASLARSVRPFASLVSKLGVLFVLVLLVTHSIALMLRDRIKYNDEVQKGRLSSSTGVGYPTDDPSKSLLLREMTMSKLFHPKKSDIKFYSINGESKSDSKNGERMPPPEQPSAAQLSKSTAVRYAFTTFPEVLSPFRDEEIEDIWDIAPFLSFIDREDITTKALIHGTQRDGLYRIVRIAEPLSSSNSERDYEILDQLYAKDVLIGVLWYAQSVAFPEMSRLARARRYHRARELARSTSDLLLAFDIENSELDKESLRRVNAIYMAELLFERPEENLTHAIGTDQAITELSRIMDPVSGVEVSINTVSPSVPDFFARIVYLGGIIERKDEVLMTNARFEVEGLTVREADAVRLLAARNAFWLAWQDCFGVRQNDCDTRLARFRQTISEVKGSLKNPNFKRDIDRYFEESQLWG